MKLSNIMVSSTLAILAQEREKLQAKENRSIARRAFRLLALFPHFDSRWEKERIYVEGEEWFPGHSI